MTPRHVRNMAASVFERLKQRRLRTGEDFNLVAVHGAFFAADDDDGDGDRGRRVNADAQAGQRMVGFDRRRSYLERLS